MQLHIPTLLTALFTVMLTAAGITTFVGLTQRIYRGFWYWVAAQWLACLGLAMQLVPDAAPQWRSLSILMMLQWPITMLAGARRFYVRTSFPTNSVFDVVVIALSYLLWWTIQANGGNRSQLMTAFFCGMVVVHAYAFWVGLHVREWRHSAPLRGLLGLLLLIGVVYTPRAVMGLASTGGDPSAMDLVAAPWTLLLTTCCVLFSLYLVMLLTNERTERGLQDSQRQLRVLANIDMLTQVPNRRYFNDLATQSLQLNAAAEATLMVLDIDHFKDINDTQGHAAGDDALRLVARSARETLRARDVLGRLGGDEFIVLLPETTVADALHVADRIVLHVDAQRPPGPGSGLSLSFGVVQMLADEALDRAVRRADQALEEAKRQGRSRAVAAGENAGGEPVFTETRPLGASVF